MLKENAAGMPSASSPSPMRSGSMPENTVMLASETMDNFSVNSNKGSADSRLPPKNSEMTNIQPT
ncbi:hypothetical protein D1872_341170 [compost metagenome]